MHSANVLLAGGLIHFALFLLLGDGLSELHCAFFAHCFLWLVRLIPPCPQPPEKVCSSWLIAKHQATEEAPVDFDEG